MKRNKLRIMIPTISIIIIFASLILIWNFGIFRLQHHDDEYRLRHRSGNLTYVGDTLFWSVDSCESMGIVYDTGVFTFAYGHNDSAVYYWFPLFGGKKTTPATIYVSDKIDCNARNNIFNGMSLADKNGDTVHYDLEVPINAYAFCTPYSGAEMYPNTLNELGTVSLDHAEVEWLHLSYTVYCDDENYYCYKINGVYENGELNESKKWFVLTDESLLEWFSSQHR